jgi:GR25 family glycosyltransferase involved in LPS biosynthesis
MWFEWRKWSYFLVLFLIVFSADAKFVEHLKSASNKGSYHHLRNIDFIYMINLDQRPEKFADCSRQLNPYGVYPYRFSAVNGWELSLEAINAVGVKYAPGMTGGIWATSFLPQDHFKPHDERIKNVGQTYFCHHIAQGPIGIFLSHLSVLQDAYQSGYQTIWVMEDDINVLRDPNLLSDLIDRLDEKVGMDGWDILFTDQDIRDANGNYALCSGMAKKPNFNPKDKTQYSIRKDIDSNFRQIGARFGAHSMILRRSGIQKILEFIHATDIFLPYDMEYYLPIGIKMFTVLDDVVTNQAQSISDNGAPNYLRS